MSATSYNGLGTTINVRAAGTNVSVGFNTNVAIVGGYDAASGSATAGNVEYVPDSTSAESLFGIDSELYEAYNLATINGAGEVYAVAVPETSTTESVTASSSMTLSNTPIFDPTVQTEHEITVTDDTDDSDVDVQISYADSLSTPDSGAVVNPLSGDVAFASSGDYTVAYDYGDYTTAIQNAAAKNVRFVHVLSEATSVKNTLITELEEEATDIRFKRGIAGATPEISSSEISNYSAAADHQRLIEVAPARGNTGDGEQRTVSAVGGAYASQPLGESLTYDAINGFESLNKEYRPSQARDFTGVTAIADTMEIVEGVTTSTDDAFSDVYKVEIVDAVAQGLYQIGRNYAGGPNTQDDRDNLATDAGNLLSGYARQRPPLLNAGDGSKPYSVNTSLGSTDEETIMNVGVEPLTKLALPKVSLFLTTLNLVQREITRSIVELVMMKRRVLDMGIRRTTSMRRLFSMALLQILLFRSVTKTTLKDSSEHLISKPLLANSTGMIGV